MGARHAEVAAMGNARLTAGASAHQALSTGTGGLEAPRKASYNFWSLPSHEYLTVTLIKFQIAWTFFFYNTLPGSFCLAKCRPRVRGTDISCRHLATLCISASSLHSEGGAPSEIECHQRIKFLNRCA